MIYTATVIDDIVTIGLEGDLIGGYNDTALFNEVDELVLQGALLCMVDLSKVRYINSTGLGILTTLLAKFRNRGGELVLTGPSEQLKKLLIITKLMAIFSVADNPTEAIVKLKSE